MVNRTDHAESDRPQPVAKEPYEPPSIEEEAVFENYALACSYKPLQNAKCNNNPRS